VKFSLRPKTRDPHIPVFLSGKRTYLTNPGPGTYENAPGITKTGKFHFARFKDSGATIFSPPTSKRFLSQKPYAPGPGHY